MTQRPDDVVTVRFQLEADGTLLAISIVEGDVAGPTPTPTPEPEPTNAPEADGSPKGAGDAATS